MCQYKVIQKIQETLDVATLQFVEVDEKTPTFKPGQFITVTVPGLDPAGRSYSLSGRITDSFLSITVKAMGEFSKYLCNLNINDTIQGSKPYGFLFKDNKKPLTCIAAGIGISPLWSVIQNSIQVDPIRPISLIYSNKTTKDIVFKDRIKDHENKYSNFKAHHFITRQDDIELANCTKGRIITDKIIPIIEAGATYLICGSQNFVVDMYRMLSGLGINEEDILTETFFEVA